MKNRSDKSSLKTERATQCGLNC